MASIVVTGVRLLENPAMFHDNFQFEITFECLTPLNHGTANSQPSNGLSAYFLTSQGSMPRLLHFNSLIEPLPKLETQD